jgi:hypothetical protein
VLVLQAFGYTTLMGVTYGFAQRLAQIFWSCFGLLNYASLMPDGKVRARLAGGSIPELSQLPHAEATVVRRGQIMEETRR